MHAKLGVIALLCSTFLDLTGAKLVRRIVGPEPPPELRLDRLMLLGPALQAKVNKLWMDSNKSTKIESRQKSIKLIAPQIEQQWAVLDTIAGFEGDAGPVTAGLSQGNVYNHNNLIFTAVKAAFEETERFKGRTWKLFANHVHGQGPLKLGPEIGDLSFPKTAKEIPKEARDVLPILRE